MPYAVSEREPNRQELGTSSSPQHFALKMSASLTQQFEGCAARCFELAQAAKTAGRARFMQMAREYQSAAALIRERSDLRPLPQRLAPLATTL